MSNDEIRERVIARAIAIQSIPAPTFGEAQRAAFVREALQAEGLKDVQVDDLGNVFARIPGVAREPFLVLSAHTDTVFPIDTDLNLKRSTERITGPGIGDNSLGVAGLFGLLWMLQAEAITLPGDVWLVANVAEEGLGNLVGMQAVVKRFAGGPAAYIILEGLAYGRVFHQGLGVCRYEITATGPGGHSWVDFGRPSAVVALAKLVLDLQTIPLPARPRSSLTVGVISGGTSVNTIPAHATLQLDLRSTDPVQLQRLREKVEKLVAASSTSAIEFSLKLIGERPVGAIKKSHPLVKAAVKALEKGGKTAELNIGSTDANVPLSMGYPAVCIGLTTGGDAHTTAEFMNLHPLNAGLRQLQDLVCAAYSLENR
jgi:acetylornithine deacetylase/succinyl-diaminopimelate desuccinylase-like protein